MTLGLFYLINIDQALIFDGESSVLHGKDTVLLPGLFNFNDCVSGCLTYNLGYNLDRLFPFSSSLHALNKHRVYPFELFLDILVFYCLLNKLLVALLEQEADFLILLERSLQLLDQILLVSIGVVHLASECVFLKARVVFFAVAHAAATLLTFELGDRGSFLKSFHIFSVDL